MRFLTCSTTGRGTERVNGSVGLPDMTPYGRGEAWEDNPRGWPEGRGACWYWRSGADGNATSGPTSRPVPQWTRPGLGPRGVPSAGTATTTDRLGTRSRPVHPPDPGRPSRRKVDLRACQVWQGRTHLRRAR